MPDSKTPDAPQDALPKKKGYHHGNLHAALLEAGELLLREKGIADISLRAVAKAANVSHAAPYRHFKDKEHLLASVAERGFQALIEAMESAAQELEDPAHRLREAVVAYVSFAMKNSEMHHLMFGGLLDQGETALVLQDSRLGAFGALRTIVDAGARAGIYRDGSAREMTLTAWSLMHGFAMLMSTGQLQAGGSIAQVEAMARSQAELLLQGMLKRE